MRLHSLISTRSARRPRKILGRGHGSGHGKTSGKGHKGQKARAGGSIRPMFESGHVPLYRRLPKRGFNNARFKTEYTILNVGDLERLEAGEVGREQLVASGLIKKSAAPVKLLANGDATKAFQITVAHCSAAARAKIEAAGGTVTVTRPAPPAEEEKSND